MASGAPVMAAGTQRMPRSCWSTLCSITLASFWLGSWGKQQRGFGLNSFDLVGAVAHSLTFTLSTPRLSNEPDLWYESYNVTISPQQHAQDFETLAALVKQVRSLNTAPSHNHKHTAHRNHTNQATTATGVQVPGAGPSHCRS